LGQGFRIAVLTNASLPKDHPVAQAFMELGIPLLTRTKKPLPFAFWRALRLLGAQKKEAVVIGDQLVTDVLGGKFAGLYTILVEPLSPREARRTKFNRFLERLFGRPTPRAPRGSER
jgi:HAD superfamily phosphatase (TIGR01668 family)